VVAAAHAAGLPVTQAHAFASEPGRGVRAHVEGHHIEIVSPAHLLTGSEDTRPARLLPRREDGGVGPHGADGGVGRLVDELQGGGHTVVVVRVDGVPAGVLALADRMRPGTAEAVAHLTELTGSAPVLLTGDNPRAAAKLAAEAGIGEVRADLLPEDKVNAVHEMQAAGGRVALVGDGVNDAPALASAHVGIAMGRTGSDLALDTADAVITRDEPATVPAVIALARRARRLVMANLAIAATFIAVLVAWDLFGDLPLPLGVAGHEGSTIIVGLNGLRLLRDAAWHRAAGTKESRTWTRR
jgi:cation transport ATPase